ncbi:MAG: MarR family winged helix-turn-helix transcriptional regulator, partial [Erythrobacter sp.]
GCGLRPAPFPPHRILILIVAHSHPDCRATTDSKMNKRDANMGNGEPKTKDTAQCYKHASADISQDQLQGIIPRPSHRLALGANDGPVDDFIALTENWTSDCGGGLTPAHGDIPSETMLDTIMGQLSGAELRCLGTALLKLADAVDDSWDPHEVRSTYFWLSKAGKIERRSFQLAQVAMRIRATARKRTRHLSGEWFGEPAWNMLLELFIQFAGGARVSTKSLIIASEVADTTALRVIDRLVEASLVERSPSKVDKRVTLVSLTREGVIAVGSVLTEAEA